MPFCQSLDLKELAIEHAGAGSMERPCGATFNGWGWGVLKSREKWGRRRGLGQLRWPPMLARPSARGMVCTGSAVYDDFHREAL